jgi:hypothetical protein
MVTFGSHVGNHQFQPFLSGVYAGVILGVELADCMFNGLRCKFKIKGLNKTMQNSNKDAWQYTRKTNLW